MKFWQKAFIGILAVFIISINLCLYLTSQYAFSLNMKRDADRASGEYHFIMNGVYEAINTLYYREQDMAAPSSIESVMRSYADYYKNQGVYLELKQSDKLMFTNIPFDTRAGIKAPELKKDAYQRNIVTADNGINYLVITGKARDPFDNFTLTYTRDLSELYDTHARLTRYLITVSALVEVFLALILVVLLKKLTHPIRIMQKATRKIAGGEYDERISMRGKDEFYDLAENFNQMAASIREKMLELDKNARDKQRLMDNLAHELRTPLTSIRGYAEYLQGANTTEDKRIKATSYIISESDRMKNLTFKLLDLALVRNGRLDLQEIIPLDLFDQVKTALEATLNEKAIQINIHCRLDKLIGDPILLQSLLENLITNAVKASSYGSSVELSAYFETVPILEVRDLGYGMNEDEIAMVCEPFYRVDKARSRSSGGIGLGLSLCREIVHLHGAELKITSQPGKGTRIQIRFTTSLQVYENSLIP